VLVVLGVGLGLLLVVGVGLGLLLLLLLGVGLGLMGLRLGLRGLKLDERVGHFLFLVVVVVVVVVIVVAAAVAGAAAAAVVVGCWCCCVLLLVVAVVSLLSNCSRALFSSCTKVQACCTGNTTTEGTRHERAHPTEGGQHREYVIGGGVPNIGMWDLSLEEQDSLSRSSTPGIVHTT